MKNSDKYIEADYGVYEAQILEYLVPKYIPKKQWRYYLEVKFDKEKKANKYSK